MKSAFEKFGIREANGAFCRMTTHQLRHWLNHIADKGGLPVELQTRWLGRENAKDTEAYRMPPSANGWSGSRPACARIAPWNQGGHLC